MVTCENPPQAVLEARPGTKSRGWGDFAPAAVIALAFAPMLALFARDLWARPHYQFFPLVIPGAAALLWRSCRRLGTLEPGAWSTLGWAAAGLAWLLLAVGVAFITPWFAA